MNGQKASTNGFTPQVGLGKHWRLLGLIRDSQILMFMKYCPLSLFFIFFLFSSCITDSESITEDVIDQLMFLDWTPQNSEARPRIVRYNSYWGQWIQCNNSHDCVSTVSRHLVRYWQYLTVSLHDIKCSLELLSHSVLVDTAWCLKSRVAVFLDECSSFGKWIHSSWFILCQNKSKI